MRTTAHLDWLEWTIPIEISQADWLPPELLPNELSTKDGHTAHYNTIKSHISGILAFTNGERRQGTHILITGEPLETLRADGMTDRALVAHALSTNGKISRLDVAVNIHDGTVKAQDLEAAYLADECITRAREAQKRQKLKTDEDTLYIGSPTSDRRFRAYNKGAQLHTGEAWLRLELQLRKLRAQAVGQAIVTNQNTRAVIDRAIKDFVDFPAIPEYVTALADDDATIDKVPRKPHRTYAWLMNIVAPALARYAKEHPDDNVFDAFYWAYKAELAHLSKEGVQSSDNTLTER